MTQFDFENNYQHTLTAMELFTRHLANSGMTGASKVADYIGMANLAVGGYSAINAGYQEYQNGGSPETPEYSEGWAVTDALVNKQFQAIFQSHLTAFPSDAAFTDSIRAIGRSYNQLTNVVGPAVSYTTAPEGEKLIAASQCCYQFLKQFLFPSFLCGESGFWIYRPNNRYPLTSFLPLTWQLADKAVSKNRVIQRILQ
ncbi:MAG: hypothetical protein H6868_02935 [Rhodospirillales bacterium]|nr:hypothetical protein [Rhodospirillales bacterium]